MANPALGAASHHLRNLESTRSFFIVNGWHSAAARDVNLSGRTMSPLVQGSRAGSGKRPDPTDQHWTMLLFESLSAGVMAVGVGMAAVMVVVGVYSVVVWPLTFWDLANLGLERYASWADTVLWSVFAGGSLAGFWCFSGAAFKTKAKPKVPEQPTRGRR
jgi:hypothetical protein